jgi:hypothetical protein
VTARKTRDGGGDLQRWCITRITPSAPFADHECVAPPGLVTAVAYPGVPPVSAGRGWGDRQQPIQTRQPQDLVHPTPSYPPVPQAHRRLHQVTTYSGSQAAITRITPNLARLDCLPI